jgi:predicted CopG family antitoxin
MFTGRCEEMIFRFRQLTTSPVLTGPGSAHSGQAPPHTQEGKKSAKIIHTYNAYNLIMSAVKRIPVTEPVWKDLAEMRSAGQTYTDLLAEMIEDRKRRRLEEDVRKWSDRKKKGYVSLSEIKD